MSVNHLIICLNQQLDHIKYNKTLFLLSGGNIRNATDSYSNKAALSVTTDAGESQSEVLSNTNTS